MTENSSQAIPVFKITINKESDDSGEKFVITPENFVLPTEQSKCVTYTDIAEDARTILRPAGSHQYMKCAVPSCTNYFDGLRTEFAGIAQFSFPTDPELRDEWLRHINAPSRLNTSMAKVCSAHFRKEDMYRTSTGLKVLKHNALPLKKLVIPCVELQSSEAEDTPSLVTPCSKSSPTVSWITDRDDLFPKITNVHSMSTVAIRKYRGATKTVRSRRPRKELDESVNPEDGLIYIPASINVPPRVPVIDLIEREDPLANSQSVGRLEMPYPLPVEVLMNQEDPLATTQSKGRKSRRKSSLETKDDGSPGGKRSRTKRNDYGEEDGWEPSQWVKRKLVKHGYRESAENLHSPSPNTDDEGWRIVEAIGSSNMGKTDPNSPHPGTTSSSHYSSNKTNHKVLNSENGADKQDEEHPLSDSSLLPEWSFFKSLLPDLRKMTSTQRDDLKTFIIESLNDKIYGGKIECLKRCPQNSESQSH